MNKERTLYCGNVSIINRKIEDKDYELVKGLYEAGIAITDSSSSQLLLTKKFCATSKSWEWVIPVGTLVRDGDSMRGCVIESAHKLGFTISNEELEVLAYYYPCINYDCSKHAIFTARVSNNNIGNLVINGESAKWFDFNQIDKMISESEIMDGKTMLAYYKLNSLK